MTEFEPPEDDRDEIAVYYDAITACRHRLEKEYGPINKLLTFTHPHDFHELVNAGYTYRPVEDIEEMAHATIKQTREVPEGMILVSLGGTFPEFFAIEHLDDHRTI